LNAADVTITIGPDQVAPLLASARTLVSVKLDSIAEARKRRLNEAGKQESLESHRFELAEFRRVVDQLEHAGDHPLHPVTARRPLVDEIVLGALVVESQELADALAELGQASHLSEVKTRLRLVAQLVDTLANLRSEPLPGP
jgi:hypothetical protein